MRTLKLILELEAEEKFSEDHHFSSAIRGIFGRKLKRAFCLQKNIKCNKCSMRNCLYYRIFEKKYSNRFNIRPYIIEHLSTKNKKIHIQSIFFGDITNNFSEILMIFLKMRSTQIKVNKKWIKFRLKKIEDHTGKTIYENRKDEITEPSLYHINLKNISTHLSLKFITPLRMKKKSRLMSNFDFQHFYNILHAKILHINKNFYNNELELPSTNDNNIKVIKKTFSWKEFYRESFKQNQKMSLGGLIGSIELIGVNSEAGKILQLGEHFHAGKQSVFGLGKYEIKEI